MVRETEQGRITESQRYLLARYIELRRESDYNLRDPLWLTLVIAGEKPGTHISENLEPRSTEIPDDGWNDDLAEQLVPEEMDIRLLDFEDETSPDITVTDILDAFEVSYQDIKGTKWFVARHRWRFELLPTGTPNFKRAYHRRLGCFFGYAREDIEYFIESDHPRGSQTDFVEAGIFEPDELAYVVFVPHVYKRTPERIEQAITTGKAYHDRLIELAETWDVPALKRLTNTVYENAL